MQILRQVDQLPETARGGAVAIGNFDGVHRGHARLVEKLIERARGLGGPAIVFTFDPHPVRILRPHQYPPPLTWTERKAELLKRLGVDLVIAYPTDEALLRLSAEEFFDLVVRKTLNARAMVEGPNFYFGHGRQGDVELLSKLTESAGMSLDIVKPAEEGDAMISSSRIRKLIGEQGDVGKAASMLTAPYRVRGIVIHGAGRGTKLGFPTANLEGIDTILPAPGVYAGVGRLAKGRWPAAINIGANPTFGENESKVEAHLIGCDESAYGQPLEIDFLERLRDVATFTSGEELSAQVEKDIATARATAEKAMQTLSQAP